MSSALPPPSQHLALRSDPELVELMAIGDTRALDVLYDRYARIVFSFALRILGDRATAEEVLQEAFFRAWRQARTVRDHHGFFITWLLSVTHDLAIDECRTQNRRPRKAPGGCPERLLTDLADIAWPVEEPARIRTVRAQIAGAFAALPASHRHTIELAYFGGLTYGEIAKLQGLPVGTVKTRLRLGLRKLREQLDGQAFDLV